MTVAGRTKKEVIQEFRTAEILEAARGVFAEKGFEGATIDSIALAAGVAKGTVYLYFESKRELFLASLRDGVCALHEEVAAQMANAENCEAKLHAFIAGRFLYFSRNHEFFRIYYTEFSRLICGTASAQPEFQDLYERQAALLEGVLAQGIREGRLREFEVPRTARLIYDLIRTALAHHILHGGGEEPGKPVRAVFDFVWKGIGAQ
ncbi:MAG TPA: TetR/AcrR family transcriptional regulator [Bryobacteraceae bacterium]|nr:TetR/AcrR family transcriptional regulator [Bryobacteraceae bacterium]